MDTDLDTTIRATRKIKTVENKAFQKLWEDATPSCRFIEISLPVFAVLRNGVYYIPSDSWSATDSSSEETVN